MSSKPIRLEKVRFGNSGGAIVKALANDSAGPVYRFFRRLGAIELSNRGGLSLEDWAARLLTIFGVYLPQGFIAFRENKHKWETNGRNALIWTLTILVTMMVKSDRLSLNTLLNVFMKDKNKITPGDSSFKKLLSLLQFDGDYFEILKNAGVRFKETDRTKAFWSSLDDKKLSTLINYYDDLIAKPKEAITAVEQKMLRLIPKFMARRNLFNLISTGIITVLTMYVIGRLAMEFVFRFIAPFDHDFDPTPKKAKPQASQRPRVISYPERTNEAYQTHPASQSRFLPVTGISSPGISQKNWSDLSTPQVRLPYFSQHPAASGLQVSYQKPFEVFQMNRYSPVQSELKEER